MGEGLDYLDVLRGDVNLLEEVGVFGKDVSADPRIVIPILLAIFAVLIILAMRAVLKDKGKSEMSDDELAKDRALLRDSLAKEAALRGREVNTELLMSIEAKEIAAGKRISGKE